jgi:hypothetical protein
MFLFSVAIYASLGLICLYAFRHYGAMRTIGYSSVLLIAAYSSYELAFKLSFLAFGPDYVRYFTSYDIYPSLVFAVSVCTVLAISDIIHLDGRVLSLLLILCATWSMWLISGNFPVNIQVYEANPNYYTLVYNYSTKLLGATLFAFAVRNH